jgi:hypothetical protein
MVQGTLPSTQMPPSPMPPMVQGTLPVMAAPTQIMPFQRRMGMSARDMENDPSLTPADLRAYQPAPQRYVFQEELLPQMVFGVDEYSYRPPRPTWGYY